MSTLFMLLFLLSFVCMIIGLIKPSLVIRWGNPEKRTRAKAVLTYFLAAWLFFFANAMLPDDPNKQSQPAGQQVKSEAQQKEEAQNKIRQEILDKIKVTVNIDHAIMDSKDNTKVGIFLKNDSDYRITKGSVTVRLKDAAGNTVDRGTLDFIRPIDPQRGSAGVLWMKAKRVISYEGNVSVREFDKP